MKILVVSPVCDLASSPTVQRVIPNRAHLLQIQPPLVRAQHSLIYFQAWVFASALMKRDGSFIIVNIKGRVTI